MIAPNGTPRLSWESVSLDLGAFKVVNVSIDVRAGEWRALVGPTGAGKTLLLEMAAGFLSPTEGDIRRDGRSLADVPPEGRRLGYVPQDDLLFPHLSVRRNVAFGARARGAGPDLDARLDRAMDALGIAHLESRSITSISGGEAQRVALARALVTDVDVLLLDECTSALDADTRRLVGDVVSRWRDERGAAIVQITHDAQEAAERADAVTRIVEGRIVTAT